ncbi:MAG: B12-binding domain-containing radical SAM protein [Clostridia bacterium]|nr:B12-binding domain-containing radical SAM protein [Clostridia bacterium]
MKVMLVFPPQYDVTMPPLGLPCLAAVLRKAGHEVIQKDLNIESFDKLMSKDELSKAHFSICMNRRNLIFSGADPLELNQLISRGEYLVSEVENAKASIKQKEDFFVFEKYFRNINILNDCMRLLSMAYFPSRLSFYGYSTACSARSTAEILEAVKDKERNLYIEYYEKYTIPGIIAESPKIIGLSIAVESQVIPALTLAHMIKKRLSGAHVVIGGSFFTRMEDAVKENTELFSLTDSIIIHEGETPLLKLIECLDKEMPLNDIPNLIYCDDSKIVANEVSSIENIDMLPTPDFEGLPLELYLMPENILPAYATRGCYWGRCAFCSFYLNASGKFRYRGAEKITDDLKALSEKYKCKTFTFIDEAIPPKYLSQIADSLLQEGIDINWSTHTRFENQLNDILFNRLRKSGCFALGFGLESACDRVLKAMNKGIEVETIRRVLEDSKKAGIGNHVSLFFGFPTETREEAAMTVRFILENLDNIDSICYEAFNLVKGSQVYNDSDSFGISKVNSDNRQDLEVDSVYKTEKGMSREEAVEIKELFSSAMLEAYKSIQIINCHEALYLEKYHAQGLAWATASEAERLLREEEYQRKRKEAAEERMREIINLKPC